MRLDQENLICVPRYKSEPKPDMYGVNALLERSTKSMNLESAIQEYKQIIDRRESRRMMNSFDQRHHSNLRD